MVELISIDVRKSVPKSGDIFCDTNLIISIFCPGVLALDVANKKGKQLLPEYCHIDNNIVHQFYHRFHHPVYDHLRKRLHRNGLSNQFGHKINLCSVDQFHRCTTDCKLYYRGQEYLWSQWSFNRHH